MVTPNDMPKIQTLPAPAGGAPRIQNLPMQQGSQPQIQLLNQQASTPLAPTDVSGMDVSETAAGLYVDPTPAFQPSIDFIGGQRTQANERYAQNKADIANIFGNLTTVNKESQDRVRNQFETSIANQQMNTAQRMAEARMGAEQTQASALQAMDERGGGPMSNLAASPAAVASERAIGDIGTFGTIWEGQQRAIQEQSQQDLQAGLRGLGQQEVFSNQQLQRSLEDTLNQLAGQEVGVRSDLAQAIIGGQSQVAQANYNEILAERAAEEARRLAAVRGAYDVQQAQIDADRQLELARINAQNRVVNYPQNSAGVNQFIRNEGGSDQDVAQFWGTVDSIDMSTAANSQDAFQQWITNNTRVLPKGRTVRPSAGQQAAARLYFDGLRYNRPDDAASLVPQVNFGAWDPYGTQQPAN
jgi:hypothetical protein